MEVGLKCFSMRMTLDLLDEFANTEVFCLFHNCMWQARHSEFKVYFLELCEQTSWLSTHKSPFACLICVYVFVFVVVLIYTFNRHWHTTLYRSLRSWVCAFVAKQDIFSDFLGKQTRWLLTHRSPRAYNWIFGLWLGLLGVFTTSSNFWSQFFHSFIFKGNLWRRSRWHIYLLVHDFSSFHHNSFRDTTSWECVVKDDGVRSCLIKLKSFLVSKVYIDPIHRVLMYFPLQGQCDLDLCVLCSWDPQTYRIRSFFCSNFVLPVSFLNLWWNVNWLNIRCDKCTRRTFSE